MLPAVLGLLACQCEGRSSLDEPRVTLDFPPSGPASTPTTLTPQAFADSYPEAFCDRYAGCCDLAATSHEQCLAHQRAWVDDQSKAPGLVFDAGRAVGCLDELRGWAGDYDLCMLVPGQQFATCTNVYSPDPAVRYPGERCEQDVQCEEHYQSRCALDESTGQRICQYNPSYDEQVGYPFGPCRTDLPGTQVDVHDCGAFSGRTCSEALDQCSFEHDVGETCFGTGDCLPHLACDDGLCVPARAEGQSCSSSPPSLCDRGLFCEDGQCFPTLRATPGGPCSFTVPLYCDEGTCVDGTCQAVDPNVARECGRPLVP